MSQERHAIPDKLYFRIGEVSDIVGVKPYVLRYWETEFSDIKPMKSKSGQRLYKRRDVELLLKIKELLYDKRFTINGAKQRLKETGKAVPKPESAPVVEQKTLFDDAPQAKDVEEKVSAKKEFVAKESAVGVDAKFLHKIRGDLEWCLSEINSSK